MMSVVSGELWDLWDRMTAAELAMFVGSFGVDAVPANLHRRADRLAAVMAAARDAAGPNTNAGRRTRRRAECAVLWDRNVLTIEHVSDGGKAMARARRAAQQRRRRARVLVAA